MITRIGLAILTKPLIVGLLIIGRFPIVGHRTSRLPIVGPRTMCFLVTCLLSIGSLIVSPHNGRFPHGGHPARSPPILGRRVWQLLVVGHVTLALLSWLQLPPLRSLMIFLISPPPYLQPRAARRPPVLCAAPVAVGWRSPEGAGRSAPRMPSSALGPSLGPF